MNPQKPQFFAIIVHYGDPASTRNAVAALQEGTLKAARIIIVDHGQQPFQSSAAENISVIRPLQNGGYGAGVNVGLGALLSLGARADDTVIAMNNDVRVYPETLAHLAAWQQQHPQPALVGVITEEGKHRIAGGGTINRWTGRAELNYLKNTENAAGGQPSLKLRQAGAPPAPRSLGEVGSDGGAGTTGPAKRLEYIHGAFFAAPYQVFLRTQGLPEQYFLYHEDTLFSLRVRRLGVPLAVADTVRVYHRAAGEEPLKDHQLYYLVRNGALFMEGELPYLWQLWWQAVNRVRWLYHRSRPGKEAAIITRALRDARRGVTGRANIAA